MIRKYSIEISVVVLNILFIIALGIEFMSIADLVGILWRISAIIIMASVYIATMAVVLVTNTRRPAGIDPNDPPQKPLDPFGLPTDALWEEGMPDRRQHKRRASDIPDPKTVTRLIEHFQEVDSERPMVEETPKWALDLQQEHGEE